MIAKSRDAYKQFRFMPAPRRGELIRQIREALSDKVTNLLSLFQRQSSTYPSACFQRDELGALVSLEMGKIYTEGQGEVQEFVDIVSRSEAVTFVYYLDTHDQFDSAITRLACHE